MTKKQQAVWQPPIDQTYEAHVTSLASVDGRLSDDPQTYAIERVQKPPAAWVPAQVEGKPVAAIAYRAPEQPIMAPGPDNIQQQVVYTVTPGARADALIKRLVGWSIPLTILTGLAMYIFSLYPATLATLAIFALWMALALTETLIVFLVLSIIDYRETPAAQNRLAMNKAIRMMAIEQGMRLIGTYGEETYAATIKAIRRAGF